MTIRNRYCRINEESKWLKINIPVKLYKHTDPIKLHRLLQTNRPKNNKEVEP